MDHGELRFLVKNTIRRYLKASSRRNVPKCYRSELPGANFVHYVASSKAAGAGLRVPEPQIEHLPFSLKVSINI